MPRRYGQWAASVLFVLVAMFGAGWVWQQRTDRVEVLGVDTSVPAGSVIERSDLTVMEVAGVGDTISADQLDRVVGTTAAVSLVPGQVLSDQMVTGDPVPGIGQRVVGVELGAGRMPGGLAPGDNLTVIEAPPDGDPGDRRQLERPAVLADGVSVLGIVRVQGAGTRVTLVVPETSANRVAAFAAARRLAVVQAPVGGDR